jgi:hypothetical protein
MERAMTTILHFSDSERAFVAERRADAAGQWMMSSWLTFDSSAAAAGTGTAT